MLGPQLATDELWMVEKIGESTTLPLTTYHIHVKSYDSSSFQILIVPNKMINLTKDWVLNKS